MKDEADNKGEGQFEQPLDRMRDVDHAAAIEVGKRADWEKNTVGPRFTAYQLLLGAIEREDPSLLADPRNARVTPQTVGWLLDRHHHLAAQSVVTILRGLVGFCSAAFCGRDVQYIRDRAQEYEARAAKSRSPNRRRYALGASEIPSQLKVAHEKLGPKSDYAGEFRRYLGAQVCAGVSLADLQLSDLGKSAWLSNFETILGDGATSQRINVLGCVLQSADIDARAVFDRAAEIRRQESSKPGLYDRRSRDFEDLPEELKRRFEYVTNYDGKTEFEFEGNKLSLPKARTIHGCDFSREQIGKMRSALRMLFTILREADPVLAEQWTDWGNARAWRLYRWFYAETSPITQASRTEDLMAALRAIYGDQEHKLFHSERRQVQLLMGVARKLAEPLEVPLLPTRKIRCRARAIAYKALARLRDLRQVPWPYRDPVRLAGLFRTALIVAILAEVPVRLRTMSLLSFKIIRKSGDAYTANIPPDIMKKRRAYFETFSASVSRLLDIWIDEVRPFMLNGREDDGALFISDEGTSLSRSAYQTGIPTFMTAVYGENINMHLFRALHASELVDDGDAGSWALQHGAGESIRAYRDFMRFRDRDKTSSLKTQSQGFFT